MKKTFIFGSFGIATFFVLGYLFLRLPYPPLFFTKFTNDSIVYNGHEIKVSYHLMDFQYQSGLSTAYEEGQIVEFITNYPTYINHDGYEHILEANINGDIVHINSFSLGTYYNFLAVPNATILLVQGRVSSHPTQKNLVHIDVLHWELADPKLRLQIKNAKHTIRNFLNVNHMVISKSMIKKCNVPYSFPLSKFLSAEINVLTLDPKNKKVVYQLEYPRTVGKMHAGGVDTQTATLQIVYSLSDEKLQKVYLGYKTGFFFIGE